MAREKAARARNIVRPGDARTPDEGTNPTQKIPPPIPVPVIPPPPETKNHLPQQIVQIIAGTDDATFLTSPAFRILSTTDIAP